MSANVTLLVVAGVLLAAGVYLLLDRSLTRVLLGVLLLGNATNVLILSAGGAAGLPPILPVDDVADVNDPLPQALVLTAIVISFAMTALLLVILLASRGLTGTDHVDGEEPPE